MIPSEFLNYFSPFSLLRSQPVNLISFLSLLNSLHVHFSSFSLSNGLLFSSWVYWVERVRQTTMHYESLWLDVLIRRILCKICIYCHIVQNNMVTFHFKHSWGDFYLLFVCYPHVCCRNIHCNLEVRAALLNWKFYGQVMVAAVKDSRKSLRGTISWVVLHTFIVAFSLLLLYVNLT